MSRGRLKKYSVLVQAVIEINVDAEDEKSAKTLATHNLQFDLYEAGFETFEEFPLRVVATQIKKRR